MEWKAYAGLLPGAVRHAFVMIGRLARFAICGYRGEKRRSGGRTLAQMGKGGGGFRRGEDVDGRVILADQKR